MKVGLIIQGPIISGGFTGQTHGFGRTRATQEMLVNYNCEILINDNISKAKVHFDEIVVCTWKNQNINLKENIATLLYLDDPTPNPPKTRKAIPGFPDFDKRNNVRQFFSILEGSKYLKSKGITHAVKIRTDQGLDFDVLNKEFRKFILGDQKNFFVSYLDKQHPWIIPDFILGAEIEQLIKISKFMCNSKKQFHENVHRDLFFKAFFENDLFYTNFNLNNLFLFEDKRNSILYEVVNHSWKHIWEPASKDLYESMTWRGEKMRMQEDKRVFNGNEIEMNFKVTDFNSKKSINWDQFMIYTLGSRSLTLLILKVNKYRFHKFFRGV